MPIFTRVRHLVLSIKSRWFRRLRAIEMAEPHGKPAAESSEAERLQRAIATQDRAAIREIHKTRLARANPPKNELLQEEHGFTQVEDFTCSICSSVLFKPCVNSCGHVFCFWCLHRVSENARQICLFAVLISVLDRQAMSSLEASSCPLCRAEFTQFSHPCGKYCSVRVVFHQC